MAVTCKANKRTLKNSLNIMSESWLEHRRWLADRFGESESIGQLQITLHFKPGPEKSEIRKSIWEKNQKKMNAASVIELTKQRLFKQKKNEKIKRRSLMAAGIVDK